MVYFLKSDTKDWYYVGSTNDLDRRLREHNSGKVRSTKAHMPLRAVYRREFNDELSARLFERKVKGQRLLKESIIRSIKKQFLV